MVCHKLGSDSRTPYSGSFIREIQEVVVAVHGGSGGVTGPCVSLKRVAASVLGEIGAAVGDITGEVIVAGSETCAGSACGGGTGLSRGGQIGPRIEGGKPLAS
jgi:hypothetical protein